MNLAKTKTEKKTCEISRNGSRKKIKANLDIANKKSISNLVNGKNGTHLVRFWIKSY